MNKETISVKHTKWFYYVAAVISSIGMAMLATYFYLAFKPYNVIKANVQPHKVITPVVKPGDVFIYQVDSCKFRAAPARVVRRFVDEAGTRYPQPPEDSNVIKGCSLSRTPVAVPFNMPAGKWYIDIETTYQVNPFRSEYYHFRTDYFNIVKE